VKVISPQYIKPFVRRQKNDGNDAEAICIVPQVRARDNCCVSPSPPCPAADGVASRDEASCRPPARPNTAGPAMIPDLYRAASEKMGRDRMSRRIIHWQSVSVTVTLGGRPRAEK
jgi:hypothetical protein